MKTEAAIQILLALLAQAGNLSAAISKARAEGREDLTEGELQEFRDRESASRDELQKAIDAAKSWPRRS